MEKKYTLPAPFAKKWVEALRSGKYKQTNGRLYRPNKDAYCCLGVCGAINGISTDRLTLGGAYSEVKDELSSYVNSSAIYDPIIPEQLRGCPSENELIGELTRMNDVGNKSFSYIADWLCEKVHFEPINLTDPATQSKIESAYNQQEKK